MPRYSLICETTSSADIVQNASGGIECPAGVLQVIESGVTLSSMTFDDITWLLGKVFIVIFVSWLLGYFLRFVRKSLEVV